MNSVFEVLNSIGSEGRYMRPLGILRVTAPHREQSSREVTGDNFNRGGFSHGACTVPCDPEVNRARLSVRAMRDTHTRGEDGYSFTSYVVADYEGGKWRRLNDRFEARLSRNEYDQLLATGCVASDADLSRNVVVDLGNLPLFPVATLNAEYVVTKRSLLNAEARIDKLKYLKSAAREYFFKNGIAFEGLEPKQIRSASDPTKVAVAVPYDKVEFTLVGESFGATYDDTALRTKVGKPYQYHKDGYLALCAEIDRTSAVIEGLRPVVRLIEMSALEHFGTVSQTAIVDDAVVTIECKVEQTVQKFYGIRPDDAANFVAHNPTATVSGGGVVAPAPAEVTA